MAEIIPFETIERKIYFIRGKKVMLDRDLAKLYGVKTQALNQAVKRKRSRFPDDFMFSLNREEIMNLSQIVISSSIKHAPNVNVYTELGVSMLSSILNSEQAVQVNIQIMRTFSKLRELMATHKELRNKIEDMERKYDHQFKVVFQAIKKLIEPAVKPRQKIGFVFQDEKNTELRKKTRKPTP
ncbi:ORF6N domain-containing protein [candidate division FCPU426 bacterium]|nr:ORF6N domain-containing protein [candidate division FCPU426 bacterium]